MCKGDVKGYQNSKANLIFDSWDSWYEVLQLQDARMSNKTSAK